MRIPLVLLICSVVELMTACSSHRYNSSTTPQQWSVQDAWTDHCLPWEFEGKMGIHSAHQGASAYLHWMEQHNGWNLDLTGPLGMGAVHIQGTAHQVQLSDEHGQHWIAQTPEQLLQTTQGIRAPVSQLFNWVHGKPTNANALVQRDNNNHLTLLNDGAYQIRYSAYSTEQQLNLPHKIHITGADLSLIIAIHHWNIPASCTPNQH